MGGVCDGWEEAGGVALFGLFDEGAFLWERPKTERYERDPHPWLSLSAYGEPRYGQGRTPLMS